MISRRIDQCGVSCLVLLTVFLLPKAKSGGDKEGEGAKIQADVDLDIADFIT